jgi:hypothetical protein
VSASDTPKRVKAVTASVAAGPGGRPRVVIIAVIRASAVADRAALGALLDAMLGTVLGALAATSHFTGIGVAGSVLACTVNWTMVSTVSGVGLLATTVRPRTAKR